MPFWTVGRFDRWTGDDKFAHYGLGAMLWRAGQVYGVESLLWRVLAFVALCCLWELFEWVRMGRWTEWRGDLVWAINHRGPWPFAADFFSYRDIVAACFGALTMEVML